jgi:hypothetical protein
MIHRWTIPLFLILSVLAVRAPALEFSEIESRHFTIKFGETLSAREAHETADTLEAAYEKMEALLGGAGTKPIDVVIFARTGDFTAETGLPAWSASAMIDGAIYMQPVGVLAARDVLETTIRHEVCLVLFFRRYGGGIPPWLAEGLAVYHAGEIETIRRGLSGSRPPITGPADIDALLLDRDDRQKNRWGYVLAYEAARSIMEGNVVVQARKKGARDH